MFVSVPNTPRAASLFTNADMFLHCILTHKRNRAGFVLCLTSALVLFAACDHYDNPVIGIIPPCDESGAPVFEAMTSDVQRILVEDFTAHQCGACPPAGLELKQLVEDHPGQVLPLAIHAGPLASTNAQFTTDWTTDEGDQFWDDTQSTLNPVGRVNRMPGEGTILAVSEWAGVVEGLAGNAPSAGLQLEVVHDDNSLQTTAHVHVTWFEGIGGPVRLSLLVAENDLVAPQLWYPTANPPGPGLIEDYNHEHVLRGSMTGAKGLVLAESANAGDIHQGCYTFQWNPAWAAESSEIIAVLTGSNGVVLQAISMPVSP